MDDDTSNPQAAPARRAIASVDLGEMKDRVAQVCAAAGVRPSTWIRDLIWRELGAPSQIAATPLAGASALGQAGSYEVSLDGELTARLDYITTRGGFRTRAAAIRGLLEGVDVSSAAGSLSEAVAALGSSNHELVAIARSMASIAQKLPDRGANLLVIDLVEIEKAIAEIRLHLGRAAPLVGELRPMVKVKKDAR